MRKLTFLKTTLIAIDSVWLMLLAMSFCSFSFAQEMPSPMVVSPDRAHSLPSWMIQLPLRASPQSTLQTPLDLGQAVKKAKAELKQVIFYFYEDNCADCDRFLRDNFTQRALFEKASKAYQFIAINVSGNRLLTDLYGKTLSEEDFAAGTGILFAPSLVLLDDAGDTVVKLNGYTAPHKFRLALDYGTGRGRTHGGHFRDYLQRIAPIAGNKEMNRESFFLKPPYRLSRHEYPAIRPLLVLFEQENCMVCDEFHQAVLQRRETRDLLDSFDVVQLDIRGNTPLVTPEGKQTTASAWARSLGLRFSPTLIIYDEDGKELLRSDEELSLFLVQSNLAYVLDDTARRTMSLQQFMKQRYETYREQGIRIEQMRK